MSRFSSVITDFWDSQVQNGTVRSGDGGFSLAINPGLETKLRAMVLTTEEQVMAAISPKLANRLEFDIEQALSEAIFRSSLGEAGITLNSPDFLFYFDESARNVLLAETDSESVRQLTAGDAAEFVAFQAAASAQDLDDSYVELDHWAVFGSFEGDRLACAASVYPWLDSKLADLGVLTLPEFRGRGHARKVVHAIYRHAIANGYEPQYRCQLDNNASVALAMTSGLTLFGQWEADQPDE
jgi:GNAT superfamily N-acetyltransferase